MLVHTIMRRPYRITAIQKAINATHATNYLEIGLAKGTTFLRIIAPDKIGVEPYLLASLKRRFKMRKILFPWKREKIYEETSNDFFKNNKETYHYVFDIIFIDGLHTFHQSKLDVLNALESLAAR